MAGTQAKTVRSSPATGSPPSFHRAWESPDVNGGTLTSRSEGTLILMPLSLKSPEQSSNALTTYRNDVQENAIAAPVFGPVIARNIMQVPQVTEGISICHADANFPL